MNAKQLVIDLRMAFEKVPSLCRGHLGDKVWTRTVKRAVLDVARRPDRSKHGIDNRVASTLTDGNNPMPEEPEWLFDLTWYQQPLNRDWRMSKVVLAMECEWSTKLNDLRADFQKLLVVKAAIKLFVFQGAGESRIQASVGEFSEMISAYRDNSADEIYLFAALDLNAHSQFVFYTYDHSANRLAPNKLDTARQAWCSGSGIRGFTHMRGKRKCA